LNGYLILNQEECESFRRLIWDVILVFDWNGWGKSRCSSVRKSSRLVGSLDTRNTKKLWSKDFKM